ncbi:MAG: MotA/TolQ/ExbB proton channel family protein [Deltaproteobacteria bacterium]|nr:MotA/TolQ/ExbB proton channel family protein [Deltaproteobacteria bacterium]
MISFIMLIFSAGGGLAEWAERSRLKAPSPEDWPAILGGRKVFQHYMGQTLERLQTILNGPEPTWEEVEILLAQTRRHFQKKLEHLRILVRVGPSVGLIGTLIPMSTGLAGLSQGDMSRLSSDLVLAFTATVVGLTVGVTAFVLYSIRSRWLDGDLEILTLVMERRGALAMKAREEGP